MEKMEKVENTNSFMEEDFAKQRQEIDIIFNEIRIYTDLYLDEICKGKATPYICELKDTKEGRDKIHQFVINCLSNYTDFSIADALMEMERGLNPNMIND
jgi:hypothetical protein